jgi:hypothetical protein
MVNVELQIFCKSDQWADLALEISIASLHLGVVIFSERGKTTKWTHDAVDAISEDGLGFDVEMAGNSVVTRLHPLKPYTDFAREMASDLGVHCSVAHGWPVIELGSYRPKKGAVLAASYGMAQMTAGLYDKMKAHRLAA